MHVPHDLALPFLRVFSKETSIHLYKGTFAEFYIVVLFVIEAIQIPISKQSNYNIFIKWDSTYRS